MSNPNAYQPEGPQENYPSQHGQTQPGQRPLNPRAEFMNYRFSPEELRVIEECNIESFLYRSFPFSLGFGTVTYLGVKNGILKASPKWGPWPKVLAFGFFGYIAGKLSYQKKCQEKMMALPNSRFGEMLRKNLHRKGNNWDVSSHEAGAATALSLAPFRSATHSDSDNFQSTALNLDTSRPHYSGLNDTYTPTMEGKNDLNEELAIPTRKNTVTYDELRQKNRDRYASNTGPYNASPAPQNAQPGPDVPTAYNQQPSDSDRRRSNLRTRTDDDFEKGQRSGPKNKYGDTWSE